MTKENLIEAWKASGNPDYTSFLEQSLIGSLSQAPEERELGNTTASQATDNVSDLVVWGDPDKWKLIGKASSKNQKFMISTKAMEVKGLGVLVNVTRIEKGHPSEALTFVAGAIITTELSGDGATVIDRNIELLT